MDYVLYANVVTQVIVVLVQVEPWLNTDPPDLSVRIFKGNMQSSWSDVSHFHSGLLNFGSSCYMNATVQVSAVVEMYQLDSTFYPSFPLISGVLMQALLHFPPFIALVRHIFEQHAKGGAFVCDCVGCAFHTTLTKMEGRSVLSHKCLANKLKGTFLRKFHLISDGFKPNGLLT